MPSSSRRANSNALSDFRVELELRRSQVAKMDKEVDSVLRRTGEQEFMA